MKTQNTAQLFLYVILSIAFIGCDNNPVNSENSMDQNDTSALTGDMTINEIPKDSFTAQKISAPQQAEQLRIDDTEKVADSIRIIKEFIKFINGGETDKAIDCIYFPKPQMKEQATPVLSQTLKNILGKLLRSTIISSKEINDYAVVAFSEILPNGDKSLKLTPLYLVRINGNWKLSPAFFEPCPNTTLSEKETASQFNTLKEWFKYEQEKHTKQTVPVVSVKESSIPYNKAFVLKPGKAITFQLPNKKTVAIWRTKPKGLLSKVFGQSSNFSYGEKPFIELESEVIKLSEGVTTTGEYLSYIRSGPAIYCGTDAPSEYILYVQKYRIALKDIKMNNNNLQLTFSLNYATEEEQVGPKEKVNYYLGHLKNINPKQQLKAIGELSKLLTLGDMYAKLRKSQIIDSIKPLTLSSNNSVKSAAEYFVYHWGDAESILEKIVPEPIGKWRTEAYSLANAAKRSTRKDEICRHVMTFFQSADRELFEFAVIFFSCLDYDPSKPILLKTLRNDGSPRIRSIIMEGLRLKVDDSEVISQINYILKEENPPKKLLLEALRTANWYTDQLNQKHLLKYLKHNDSEIREMAAYAFDCSGNPQAIAPLLELTRDSIPKVRSKAAITLGRIGTKKAYNRLVELLEDRDADVRYGAVNGLRWLGDKRAIPHLEKLIKTEKNEMTLNMIKRTLRQLKWL